MDQASERVIGQRIGSGSGALRCGMVCERCGLEHSKLGVEIADRVLRRRVRKDSQRLRAFGGAYAFTAVFWDSHIGDFDAVRIVDLARGEWYRGDRQAIAKAERVTLDPFAGAQVVLPVARLVRVGAPKSASVPRQAQSSFDLGMAGRRSW